MHFKRGSLFTFIALVAFCGFLLNVSGAAAASKRIQGEEAPASRIERSLSRQASVPPFFATGKANESRPPLPFLKEFALGECESSCCWASGCNVSCSETRCVASCGPNDTSETFCRAQ